MNSSFSLRFQLWNRRLNDLPRKLGLLLATFAAALAAWLLLPYGWPFALAFVFSRMLEPFVQLLSKGRIRLRRWLAAAIGTLLLVSVALTATAALIALLSRQLSALAKALPQALTWVNETAIPAVESLYQQYRDILPAYLPGMLEASLSSLGQSAIRLAGTLSAMVTSGAWSTAASIPYALLSLMLTIMGTYYMTADRTRIAAFFQRNLPPRFLRRGRIMRQKLRRAVVGQLRSQLIVSMWITVFLAAALLLFRVRHGLPAALLIGLADALPVVGAGLFLIPWSLLSFWNGDTALGILTACLYGGTILIRQVLEPRIVGKHLGLYPLATMAAMFAGYRLAGVLGLVAGPILLNMASVVLKAREA